MKVARNARVIRISRAAVRHFFASLVLLCVILGVRSAGASYVYCPAMHAVLDSSCCAQESATPREEGVAIDSHDCCERHAIARLPVVRQANTEPDILACPVVEPWPPSRPDSLTRKPGEISSAAARVEHQGRAGPRAAARHRDELMATLN